MNKEMQDVLDSYFVQIKNLERLRNEDNIRIELLKDRCFQLEQENKILKSENTQYLQWQDEDLQKIDKYRKIISQIKTIAENKYYIFRDSEKVYCDAIQQILEKVGEVN